MFERIWGMLLLLTILVGETAAQQRTGSSTSSVFQSFGGTAVGSSNSQFGLSTQLGSGGSFRPNNSTFGAPSTLSLPGSLGAVADPFQSARQDPGAIGRASGIAPTTSVPPGATGPGFRSFPAADSSANAGIFGGMQTTPVRTMVRFELPIAVIPREAVLAAIQTSMTPSTLPGVADLSVRFEEGTATVTGQCSTERDANLAAALLLLEPGVRSVRNELQVDAAD